MENKIDGFADVQIVDFINNEKFIKPNLLFQLIASNLPIVLETACRRIAMYINSIKLVESNHYVTVEKIYVGDVGKFKIKNSYLERWTAFPITNRSKYLNEMDALWVQMVGNRAFMSGKKPGYYNNVFSYKKSPIVFTYSTHYMSYQPELVILPDYYNHSTESINDYLNTHKVPKSASKLILGYCRDRYTPNLFKYMHKDISEKLGQFISTSFTGNASVHYLFNGELYCRISDGSDNFEIILMDLKSLDSVTFTATMKKRF